MFQKILLERYFWIAFVFEKRYIHNKDVFKYINRFHNKIYYIHNILCLIKFIREFRLEKS